MAYMRGNYYLWSDRDNLHIGVADGYDGRNKAGWALDKDGKRSAYRLNASGVSIPEKAMDAFVMMWLAQTIDEGTVDQAIDRAVGEFWQTWTNDMKNFCRKATPEEIRHYEGGLDVLQDKAFEIASVYGDKF